MLVFNMVIARVFTQSLFGTYKHINLVMNIFTTVCTFGIPTTISYLYSTYDSYKKNKLINNTIAILGIISIFSSIIIVIFKNPLANLLNNQEILVYINILAIYVAIMIISSFMENLYISSDNSVMLGKIYIGYSIINFIGMIISILIFKSLYVLIFLIVSVEVLRTIIMFIYIKRAEKIYLDIDILMMINQLKFALPLGIVSIIQTINTYIDNLFISNSYTTEQYAAYANAAMDIPFVGIITVSVAAVILPRMSKEYKDTRSFDNVLKIWGDSSKKTAVIMFPIFWIVMLFSVGYIQFIFSEKYIVDSTPIFIIYLLKFPLYCTVYGNILIVLGRQKNVMYNSLIGIILNIILNFIFIRIFGIIGPAISTVLVQYIIVILQLIQISRYSKVSFVKVMPFKELAKIFILPALIAIPVYLISQHVNIQPWIKLVVFGSVIYGGSFFIYYRYNYIDKDILKLIKK